MMNITINMNENEIENANAMKNKKETVESETVVDCQNNSKNTDERYSVAEEAIQDAFLLLLGEKELERVTVADVIKKAGIVRSTFYNHYENIPELAKVVGKKTLQHIFSLMESFQAKNNRELCYSYFLSICAYTMQDPFLMSILHTPRGDQFMEEALLMFRRYVNNVIQAKPEPNENLSEVSFMISGTIGSTLGVLYKWSQEDFRTPPEKVADILTKIFMSGTLPFLL